MRAENRTPTRWPWLRSLLGVPGRSARLEPAFWHEYYCLLSRLREAISAAIDEAEPAQHVLDLGAGSAPYRSLCARHGRYWAADLPGIKQCAVHIDPQSDLPFRGQSVGLVLSSQVLEHVENPRRHLEEIRRVLVPTGSVILSTHGTWVYHPHPRDFWRWTSAGLRKQVEEAGFEILSFRGVLSMRATAAQLWQVQVQALMPRLLRPAFIAAMQCVIAVEDWAGRHSRDDDACTYVLRARPREGPSSAPGGRQQDFRQQVARLPAREVSVRSHACLRSKSRA